ncbi:MAG: L,D-transpeptidase family protein [Planctomycetota bacterium]
MTTKQRIGLLVLGVVLLAVGLLVVFARPLWNPYYVRLTGGRSVQDVINQYGPDAKARLCPHFEAAGVAYPPSALALIGIKEEKQLELWAHEAGHDWTLIHTYPVLAASGVAGPKLREGDRQVPEGVYKIEGLNPNSSYHLSMKVDYPNAFDLKQAKADGRDQPGTNIFIHGKAASIGCLAIGDPAIEELFVLVAAVGKDNVEVILLPHDPDTKPLTPSKNMPAWTEALYDLLQQAVADFR